MEEGKGIERLLEGLRQAVVAAKWCKRCLWLRRHERGEITRFIVIFFKSPTTVKLLIGMLGLLSEAGAPVAGFTIVRILKKKI